MWALDNTPGLGSQGPDAGAIEPLEKSSDIHEERRHETACGAGLTAETDVSRTVTVELMLMRSSRSGAKTASVEPSGRMRKAQIIVSRPPALVGRGIRYTGSIFDAFR